MLALMLTMSLVSCKDKATAEAPQAAEEAVEQVQEMENLSLTEIVEKAKAEAANWSVDEWKNALRGAMLNLKPIMEEMLNLQKAIESDPVKALEAVGTMQEKQKAFEDMESLMKSLEEIAKSTENGKIVFEDNEWGKQLLKELGLPDEL